MTPRFAEAAFERSSRRRGALLHPACQRLFLQTIFANLAEIAWVRELFPERSAISTFLCHAGLVGARSVFGHAIHMM